MSNGTKKTSIVVGCMRLAGKTKAEMTRFVHTAVDHGLTWFDHADIYGGGRSEELFGEVLSGDSALRREDLILQSKCGIRKDGGHNYYDLSKEYILSAVDGILRRLRTDYLDVLLLHRPDALVEPEEVAEAFQRLEESGKVRAFGVSNHKSAQIELLQKSVRQKLTFNQMQFSLVASNMVANGMEVNMETDGAADRDDSVLDYCRLHDIMIQTWSPFQRPGWRGPFIGAEEYPELNAALRDIADRYAATPTAIAAAWILRHPAGMQLIAGTSSEERLVEIQSAEKIRLTREEWYRLYRATGHPIP